MDRVELIRSLVEQTNALPLRDEEKLDALKRRADMVIRNVFGNSSEYLIDLGNIHFTPRVIHRGMLQTDYETAWHSGKSRMLNLFNTMLEELQLIGKRKDLDTVNEPLSGIAYRVFVVHGRDERIRRGMFSFLRAIGLNPIEWTDAVKMTGKASPYIGEILDAAFANAQAVVVVMTPDDEAKLRDQHIRDGDAQYEKTLTPQSRPNVLFEAGIAFGRHPDRTILVEVGMLRPFSDIGGRHTIRFDNSVSKRHELANRLRNAGCKVDVSGTDWHTEGDLTPEAMNGNSTAQTGM